MSLNYYNYIHNIIKNQAFINTDNGIIFEFTAGQSEETFLVTNPDICFNIVSNNFNNNGFSDVSAIAIIDINPSLLNNLFYFKLNNTLDINNISIDKYGINTDYSFNINYSNSIVTYGNINPSFGIKRVNYDYISYIAYTLAGISNINIFSNKNELLQGVVNMDNSFNNIINNNLLMSNIGNKYLLLDYSNNRLNPYVISTKQLLDGILYIANNNRKQIFFDDLVLQSSNNLDNIYWVPFHSGEKMSVVIKYNKSGINTRSYKIVLNCITNFIFPDNVSHIAYNPLGNLDPMYIVDLMNQMGINVTIDNFVNKFNLIGSVLIYNNIHNINVNLFRTFYLIYKEIGNILNPLDFYFKTFISNIKQPSIVNDGLINNGLNPSFQYIYLNSTIINIPYPSLRTIKASLLTSSYNIYPTLNDIQNITCDLNCNNSSNFIIRIYTRPVFSGIDNSFNPNDTFFGNYYDSVSLNGTIDYNTYNLYSLFIGWKDLLLTSYQQSVYYNNGTNFNIQQLTKIGEQQILSICILTKFLNSNIGIKNITVSYK
jgi:hypothetical protein